MKLFFILFFLALLSGCASKPVIQYVDRPVEVLVPVAKACLALDNIPKVPLLGLDSLRDEASTEDALRAARIDKIRSKQYFNESQDLLKLCAT